MLLVREPKAMIDDRSQRITLGFNLANCLGESTGKMIRFESFSANYFKSV